MQGPASAAIPIRAAPLNAHWDIPARYPARQRDDLPHRSADAGAEIERCASLAREQPLDSEQVGVAEIGNMNVIADSGAVRCVVVLPEERQAGAQSAGCGPKDAGDQVGLRIVPLAQVAGGIGAGSVEIPEAGC